MTKDAHEMHIAAVLEVLRGYVDADGVWWGTAHGTAVRLGTATGLSGTIVSRVLNALRNLQVIEGPIPARRAEQAYGYSDYYWRLLLPQAVVRKDDSGFMTVAEPPRE